MAAWLSSADPEQRAFRGGLVLRDPASQADVLGIAGIAPAAGGPTTGSDVQTLAVRCRALFQTDYALALGRFRRPTFGPRSPFGPLGRGRLGPRARPLDALRRPPGHPAGTDRQGGPELLRLTLLGRAPGPR